MSAPSGSHADAQAGAWQRAELVSEFLDQRATLLPLIDVQEDLVARLFERHGHQIARFLDVGAGDGAMTQLLRGVAPQAQAVLVDYSQPMLTRAAARLGDEAAGGWQAVRADLGDARWRDELPAGQPYDAAVSSLAIHHLPSARKRELYAEVFALLAPGAMFVNLDVVTVRGPLAGLFDEQIVANALAFASSPEGEHAHGGQRTAEQLERDLLADGDDDQPDSLPEQLQWLSHAGFADVEVHFKWAEGVIFGGTKPAAS
jgi:tRNA (cmo5U34)-methyltransferase